MKEIRQGIIPEEPTPHFRGRIEKGPMLGRGDEATVSLITLVPEDPHEQSMRFAEKKYRSRSHQIVPKEKVSENHKVAKAAGIPTYDTLFVPDDGEEHYLMTDLSDNGNNIVVSVRDINLRKVQELYADRPEQMAAFTSGEPLNSDNTGSRIEELVKKSSDAKLQAGFGAWFTVIRPDGTYDFTLGDYGNVRDKRQMEEYYKSTVDDESIEILNRRDLAFVQRRISFLQEYGSDPEEISSKLLSIEYAAGTE